MDNIMLFNKAKQAKSAEDLLTLAKENGIEITEDEAKAYFEQLNKSGELSDDELDSVAGGGCYKGGRLIVTCFNSCDDWTCRKCGGKLDYNNGYSGGLRGGGYKMGHTCPDGTKGHEFNCTKCKHCSYEKGMWLCNNPTKKK